MAASELLLAAIARNGQFGRAWIQSFVGRAEHGTRARQDEVAHLKRDIRRADSLAWLQISKAPALRNMTCCRGAWPRERSLR